MVGDGLNLVPKTQKLELFSEFQLQTVNVKQAELKQSGSVTSRSCITTIQIFGHKLDIFMKFQSNMF